LKRKMLRWIGFVGNHNRGLMSLFGASGNTDMMEKEVKEAWAAWLKTDMGQAVAGPPIERLAMAQVRTAFEAGFEYGTKRDFFAKTSIQELAEKQHVVPLSDLNVLCMDED
jgi:hypothetical protein